MGYVVGANPLAQMLFSPLLGWWANRAGSIRQPLLATLALFTAASAGYSALEVLPVAARKHCLLASRFLVGVSTANIAACRSYVSAATRMDERTGAVSMVSLAQVLGFIVGPGRCTPPTSRRVEESAYIFCSCFWQIFTFLPMSPYFYVFPILPEK